jgi:hypothetical protein
MLRNIALVIAAFWLLGAASVEAAQYGTAEEAKAMLDRAITAIKENEDRTIAFPNGIREPPV